MISLFIVCFSVKMVCRSLYGFIDCTLARDFHLLQSVANGFFHIRGVVSKPTNTVLLCVLLMPAISSKPATKLISKPMAK